MLVPGPRQERQTCPATTSELRRQRWDRERACLARVSPITSYRRGGQASPRQPRFSARPHLPSQLYEARRCRSRPGPAPPPWEGYVTGHGERACWFPTPGKSGRLVRLLRANSAPVVGLRASVSRPCLAYNLHRIVEATGPRPAGRASRPDRTCPHSSTKPADPDPGPHLRHGKATSLAMEAGKTSEPCLASVASVAIHSGHGTPSAAVALRRPRLTRGWRAVRARRVTSVTVVPATAVVTETTTTSGHGAVLTAPTVVTGDERAARAGTPRSRRSRGHGCHSGHGGHGDTHALGPTVTAVTEASHRAQATRSPAARCAPPYHQGWLAKQNRTRSRH